MTAACPRRPADFGLNLALAGVPGEVGALDGAAGLGLGLLLWGKEVVLALPSGAAAARARPGRTMAGSRDRVQLPRPLPLLLGYFHRIVRGTGRMFPAFFLFASKGCGAGRERRGFVVQEAQSLLLRASLTDVCGGRREGKGSSCFVMEKYGHGRGFWLLGMFLVWTGLGW